MMYSRLLLTVLCLGVFLSDVSAEEPLHAQIDNVLAKSQVGPSAPLANDAEFVRRVYLDLTGRIPSTEAARKFLEDKTPDKRNRLIEELLKSPACDRHLAKVFDVMLMERRGDKYVKRDEWEAYLLASMKENKPYNVLAKEILGADGVDPKTRAAVKFYLDREDMAVNLVTKDTARVFFGRDVECAQCHDHPLISDYEQSEYHGLLAFLNRSSIFQPDKKKPAVIAEKAEGTVKFKSVFTGFEGETRPRLPGEVEITEPTFKKGEEYTVKPAKNVRPVPKYSRREKFAELATAGTNKAFNRNIANRLWAVMMGRGLVDPVDLHHPENPPASAELLELLSDEFVAMKFDIKAFLKEIALSNTYQRSYRMPENFAENLRLVQLELPKLETQLAGHEKQKLALEKTIQELDSALKAQKDKAKPVRDNVTAGESAIAAMEKKHSEAKAALAKLGTPLTAKREVAKLLAESAEKAALAAQKLPGDKALADAGAAVAAQSAAWQKEVEALQKPFDAQAAVVSKLETELAAAREKLKPSQAELVKLDAEIAKTDAQYQAARSEKKTASQAAEAVQRRIGRLNLLTELAKSEQELKAAAASVKSLEQELSAAQADAATKANELAKSKQQEEELKNSQAEAAQSLASAKNELDIHAEAAQLVGEALASLETAQKQLPDDKELVAVATKLQTARDHQSDEKSAIDRDMKDISDKLKKSADELAAVEKTMADLSAALKQSQEGLAKIENRRKDLEAQFTKAQGNAEQAEEGLTESWTKHFRVAGVEHLSPEQLAWSVLEATGQVELQQAAALAAWNKAHADLAKKELTPEQKAEQAEFIEQTMTAKLQGQVNKFLPLFAASAGQPQHEFFATVDQALFFSNGNEVLGWLRPSGNNLAARLDKLAEPNQIAEELYLSILTRKPSADEVKDVADYLAKRKDQKPAALQEMAWALLTSAEFRFQH